MDFNKYRTNLTGQLSKINNEIIELEENLTQLKELRARVRGGLEVLDQLEKDVPTKEDTTITRGDASTIQGQIQKDIEELVGTGINGRHGKDMDTM
tara:strand:+ start:405 stop:692 length:288 start_codon:yes stop_codon:yes gene_type:complete